MRFRCKRSAAVLAAATTLLVAACGGSAPRGDPETLLHQAKVAVDNASAAHFSLTSSGVAKEGASVTGGEGDIVRPDMLQGLLDVRYHGFRAGLRVVQVGDTLEARLPFSKGYSKVDPGEFGLSDPAALLDPQRGLSSLLIQGTGVRLKGQERIAGELLDEVEMSVPGTTIPVLPDANPDQPVQVVAAIDPSNHQLRQVTLVGPFTSASSNTIFVLTLTAYNEHVQISLPRAS